MLSRTKPEGAKPSRVNVHTVQDSTSVLYVASWGRDTNRECLENSWTDSQVVTREELES